MFDYDVEFKGEKAWVSGQTIHQVKQIMANSKVLNAVQNYTVKGEL